MKKNVVFAILKNLTVIYSKKRKNTYIFFDRIEMVIVDLHFINKIAQ